MNNWQRLFDRRNRPAWAVLLVCISLTTAAWYGLRMQAMKNAGQQFELHAREVIGSIEERLRQHEQILLGGAGLFDASESVDRAEWHSYVERLSLSQSYQGIQGVGFSQAIRPADLQAHIAAIRAEGFPDYTVRPPGERSLYTSIIYLEPFSGRNLAAFGYDMMSETIRAKAMRMAAESGKAAISGKVKLVQEMHGKEQAGFLMYLPIYRKHRALATPEQRWEALQGFVYSPYRAEDLMKGLLGNRALMLDFVVFDGDEETDEARIYASAGEQSARVRRTPPEMSAARTIQAYGHRWTVRLQSSPAFEADFHSPLDAVILALGGGISVLLFVLVSTLIFRRERAEELARQMTEEIRLNEEKLRQTKHLLDSIIENIPTMVLLKRANDLRFELFNRAGERLLGYSRNDLIGKSDHEFFPKEQADFFAAADRQALESDKVLEIPEEPFNTASKETRYFQTWKIALRDESGKPTHLLGISIDITERKYAAESFARISNLNRAIVDGAGHLIITTDTNGVIQSFNRAAELHLGYRAEELVGKSTPAIFHDADEVARHARELADAGTPAQPGFEVFVARARQILGGDTHEWTYIRKDGSRFPVLLTITALRDGFGEINAFLGIATDITERVLAAQSKRDEEARRGAILDNVLDGIITIDELGTVETFNKSAENIFGYAAAEVIGNNIRMLMPEPYHSEHDGYLHNYMTTGIKKIIGIGRQVVGRRKDGSVFPMDLAVSEMRLVEKRMFTGVVRDITERNHAEEELRKLSRAVEQSPVSVVITDADGRIEYVNAKFSEVTGYAISEVMGQNPRIIQSGLTPDQVYRSMWQAIKGGQQWRGKLQNRKKNGELFWEEMHISVVRDGEGRATNFVAVKEDITERMNVERMKSEFISTVSHELRTPLTSIRGALALIAGGVAGELSAAAKPLVDIAHKNSERLILLVNDILDMEKIEAGKMEFDMQPVNLMPLLKQALDANHAYAEQHGVSYELEGELANGSASDLSGDLSGAMVRVDANRLMQVLTNLLSNAAKFSPPDDPVTITATCDGGRVRVAVSNRGRGIPAQFRERIFQKFAQADSSDTRKKGGTGLGLSITKAMVEQMGGSIGFDSQPDVLTTFFVEFPIWQETAAAPAPVDAAGKKRVLICEDDRDIAALLRMMLEQAGLAADIAYNAGQAKQLLAQGSYAAMTLDLDLPDQDGIALIRELRDAKPTATLPIIVVSANAIEGRKELGSEAFSIIDWISKPINQDQLVEVLKRAVRGVSGTRPRVLHVEDDPDICQVVNAIAGEFAEIDNAASVAEARQMLENNHYDLAILDLSLPDGSGMKLLPLFNGATPPVPVLVFSASEVGREDMHEIKSALVKSRTDNAQLLATIKRLIGAE